MAVRTVWETPSPTITTSAPAASTPATPVRASRMRARGNGGWLPGVVMGVDQNQAAGWPAGWSRGVAEGRQIVRVSKVALGRLPEVVHAAQEPQPGTHDQEPGGGAQFLVQRPSNEGEDANPR